MLFSFYSCETYGPIHQSSYELTGESRPLRPCIWRPFLVSGSFLSLAAFCLSWSKQLLSPSPSHGASATTDLKAAETLRHGFKSVKQGVNICPPLLYYLGYFVTETKTIAPSSLWVTQAADSGFQDVHTMFWWRGEKSIRKEKSQQSHLSSSLALISSPITPGVKGTIPYSTS